MLTTQMPARKWRTWEEKLHLLQEAEKTSIWKVAREQGLQASQMYVWRKQLRALTSDSLLAPQIEARESMQTM